VVTALAFDFTNGFHDTANAMATTTATRALPPKVAVGLGLVFGAGVVAGTRATELRERGRGAAAGVLIVGAGVALLACVAAVVVGVVEMLGSKQPQVGIGACSRAGSTASRRPPRGLPAAAASSPAASCWSGRREPLVT
jgi:phosphate/sulfate permease